MLCTLAKSQKASTTAIETLLHNKTRLYMRGLLHRSDLQQEYFTAHVRMDGAPKFVLPWPLNREPNRRTPSRIEIQSSDALTVSDHTVAFHLSLRVLKDDGPKIMPDIVLVLDFNEGGSIQHHRHLGCDKFIVLNLDLDSLFQLRAGMR